MSWNKGLTKETDERVPEIRFNESMCYCSVNNVNGQKENSLTLTLDSTAGITYPVTGGTIKTNSDGTIEFLPLEQVPIPVTPTISPFIIPTIDLGQFEEYDYYCLPKDPTKRRKVLKELLNEMEKPHRVRAKRERQGRLIRIGEEEL